MRKKGARTDDGVVGVEHEGAAVAIARLEVVLRDLLVPVPQPRARQSLPHAQFVIITSSCQPHI